MEQRARVVFISARPILSLLFDGCPRRQENILSVSHNIIPFVTINKLTFWVLCPAVVKLFHPPLCSCEMNPFCKSTPFPHVWCIKEVNKVHSPNIFSNSLKMHVNF